MSFLCGGPGFQVSPCQHPNFLEPILGLFGGFTAFYGVWWLKTIFQASTRVIRNARCHGGQDYPERKHPRSERKLPSSAKKSVEPP